MCGGSRNPLRGCGDVERPPSSDEPSNLLVAILCAGVGMLKDADLVAFKAEIQVAILCAGVGMLKDHYHRGHCGGDWRRNPLRGCGDVERINSFAIIFSVGVAILCAGVGMLKDTNKIVQHIAIRSQSSARVWGC